jgi:hypothetical protein
MKKYLKDSTIQDLICCGHEEEAKIILLKEKWVINDIISYFMSIKRDLTKG